MTPLPAPELLSEAPPGGWTYSFRALRHRNFRFFIGGQIVSLSGTWMQTVAQSWLVYRLTHSELLLGTAWFCSQIAVFALGPLGGLAADRFSRHKLVVLTQTLMMLQALGLAVLTLTGRVQVWQILALSVVLGAINAFDIPGRQSLLIQMTSREDLLSAIALNSSVFNAARGVGPGIAGLLVAALGEGVCFLLNGVSFLAVIGGLLAMRIAPFERQNQDSPWRHLMDGFRYAWHHAAVRRMLATLGATTLANTPILVLAPFFADQIFHRGSQGLGFLMAAMGVGAVVGTLGLARRTQVFGLPLVIGYSGLSLGAATLAFAASQWFYLSLAITPLIGYSLMRQLTSANTTIQTMIPDHYRGRIMALYSMSVVGLAPFGSLAAGALAARLGARFTVALGGLLALVAAAAFGWSLRRNRSTGFPGRSGILAWLLLALFASVSPASAESPAATELCGQAGKIASELATISGLKLRHPVPCDFISKEKVNEFLKKRVKQVAGPEELRAEELTLKKFGLVPPDFNLADSTVDLLTEQAAAFYDYDKKKLFITETTSPESQEPVLAHELSHAIADQNFNLGKYIRQGRKSDDGAAARLAVMEGQATWLMSEYLAHRLGQSLKNSPSLAKTMSRMSETSGQFPVFDQAPLYLRLTLLFPYTDGMLFQNEVIAHDGDEGFAEVFRRAPVSTQQIIHPEKYFEHDGPTFPSLPDPHLPSGYKGLVGGTMGELDHAALLEQFSGKARAVELAHHWRGSTFELRENKKESRLVLLYAVEWDSEDSASAYFKAYREALAKKWKKMEIAAQTPESLAGTGDDGRFELRRTGAVVTSMEGLPPAVNLKNAAAPTAHRARSAPAGDGPPGGQYVAQDRTRVQRESDYRETGRPRPVQRQSGGDDFYPHLLPALPKNSRVSQ